MLQFDKPGARGDYDYPDMAKEAGANLQNMDLDRKITFLDIWNVSCCLTSVFTTVCPHPVPGQKALADAGVPYSAIEQACVGYVYGKKRSASRSTLVKNKYYDI